ncbi:hypothetical protein C8R45DRAFT_907813 [Mycena sanguinolenta]|nr:hypothetical protein C8R45DRAFT_907813 [Mycena sanguinolenta]
MVAVMVPPWEFRTKDHQPVDREISTKSVTKRRREITDEGSSEVVKKVKKLERGEGLSAGTLRARLISAGIGTEPYPIDIEVDVRDISVRRDFMREHYGGNQFSAHPAIAKKWYTKMGHRYFVYPNLVLNPDAPMIPGAPGLFMSASGRSARECIDKWNKGPYKVSTRLGTNDNLYMGEYIIQPADSLTLAEWTEQTTAMRNKWCNKLAIKDWGKITRARIALREQLGRDPTFHEVETALKTGEKYRNVNASDIASAFDKGDERVAVWTMKCIGYDPEFQRKLVRQITGWVPPPPGPKRKPPKEKSKSNTRTKTTAKTLRQRKAQPKLKRRASIVESENESDWERTYRTVIVWLTNSYSTSTVTYC